MTSRFIFVAVALCLAVAVRPAHGDCSDQGGNVASACGSFQSAIAQDPNASDNSTISKDISASSTKVTSSCCQAFQPFLASSCRCNPSTESLLSGFNLNDQGFQQVIYAAGIACGKIGITLKDPQFGQTCNNGVASGG
ncbi:hypothetical protein WJX73_006158 [Symbiochloris irregularis]|uniref:Uncharacterized protein n=1 Tax=Symbiochloris irregularis TaxID=706552 RepID=A0AAW1NPJ4_9CHLO